MTTIPEKVIPRHAEFISVSRCRELSFKNKASHQHCRRIF
ncbi:MAG: hypothetical protein ACI9VT_003744 [Psychroserpens sp.]|jgi:hypothetical protein